MNDMASWMPVWAMPNVTLEGPVEASHAALVPSKDERLVALAREKPALETFLSAFHNEFGNQVAPTIGLVREDALKSVLTVTAFGGFRDAVCMSAVIAGQTRTTIHGGPRGVFHSDAFDVYPWFPSPQWNGHITAFTPALKALHMVDELRPQSEPALGNRFLNNSDFDRPLLDALWGAGSNVSLPASKASEIVVCSERSIWLALRPESPEGWTQANTTRAEQ